MRINRKRGAKIGLYFVLIVALACAAFIGGLVLRYKHIVGAETGEFATEARPGELGAWVNPFVGTGGIPWVCGHNFPGASVPFGAVRLSPDTISWLRRTRATNTSGYYYGDNELLGFSHTRLSGTGATDGGHFLLLPTVEPVSLETRKEGQTERFSHAEEVAFPGYYAVRLPGPDILVELTATQRVGLHRYTFPKSETPHILLDITNALGRGRSREGKVRVLPDAREIEGAVRTFGSFSGRYGGLKVYFAARFAQPFATFGTWQSDTFSPGQAVAEGDEVGVNLSFAESDESSVIELRLAISHVSLENARANLEAEAGERDFDSILADAKEAWESKLSLIEIEGATEERKRNFYTALYRTFQMPTVFQDSNGEYLGFDGNVHESTDFRYFTDLSIWDTFRTVHPLFTLIAREDQRDMLVSLVKMCEQGGWLPRWPSGHGYTNSMLGTPADMVVAGSYLKGMRDFDVETAYRAMRETALGATPRGAAFSGREGVEHYLEYGYCPAEKMREAVARTMEFAWSDHAVAVLAEALGYAEDAALFREHSEYYRNLWNPETQYFQPRDSQGAFVEAFKPLLLTYLDRSGEFTNDYVEGSALQWRWAAPFDAQGLISLFESREYFVDELNDFFALADPTMGAWNPGSYYWHGNEPDMHSAYLFNEAERPDLTQKWVRWIMDNKYGDGYAGLDGNDDAGTLSAWYVFSALGFYPIAGTDVYQLGAPLFEKARVKLGESRLDIVAENYAPERMYVRKVWLNDTPLDRTWIRHAEIEKGGVLRFEMSSDPALD